MAPRTISWTKELEEIAARGAHQGHAEWAKSQIGERIPRPFDKLSDAQKQGYAWQGRQATEAVRAQLLRRGGSTLPTHEEQYQAALDGIIYRPEGHDVYVGECGERRVLYTITTVARKDEFGGTRCWAVTSTWEKAKDLVEKAGDYLWEYSAQFCVIEPVVPDDLGAYLIDSYWYLWTFGPGEKDGPGRYLPIETPEVFRGYLAWGIG